MIALVLAAALAVPPQLPVGDVTRSIVTTVCIPFVAEAVVNPNGLRGLDRVDISRPDRRFYESADSMHLVRLSMSEGEADGDIRRTCVVQVRSGGFAVAEEALSAALPRVGFHPKTDGEPEGWAVWMREDVRVSLNQKPGRAAIVRVTFSSLETREAQQALEESLRGAEEAGEIEETVQPAEDGGQPSES